MKLFIATISSLLLFSCAKKDNLTVSKNNIDLKEMLIGNTYVDSILVKNEGSNNVRVVSVKSPCDCTTVDYPKAKLEPDDSMYLKIVVKPNTVGEFNKEIKVKTDMVENKEILIKMKGTVIN